MSFNVNKSEQLWRAAVQHVHTMSSLQSAIDRGDWARAAALLEAALTKQPADASLCFALGSVLRNQFRVSSKKPHNVSLLLKADKWYLQALTVSPQHGEADIDQVL